MVEETEDNWRDCVRQTIELAPDSVTVYQMEVPYNTDIYREMKAQGKLVAPVADWETNRHWVAEAFARLEQAGYHVGSAYTAVRDPARTRFIYRDSLWQGADLIGLGVASFSHIGGTHFQNQHDFEPYLAELSQGRLPIYRALTPTGEEGLIRELVLQLKLGRVNHRRLSGKYGIDVLARFSGPLARLRTQGYLRHDPEWLELSRDGLLQVDRLVHDFFLPEHRHARYA